MLLRLALAATVAAGTAAAAVPAARLFWGEEGHLMSGAAAAGALPVAMPGFFRQAGPQLAYLNPEPDRWRDRVEQERDRALGGATGFEHYVDFELIPAERRAGALGAASRMAYFDTLRAAGADPAAVGVLPFRILELTQRLRTSFRRWRTAPDAATRRWVEQRIIDDAGILGHYVTDGANPAHTTVHHNGWVGPNPRGYATDKQFHGRFESGYVRARVSERDVRRAMRSAPQAFPDVRVAVLAYLQRSHGEVERLYALDKAAPFDSTTTAPANHAFAVARLAAGATMLRDLWWTAWVTSADSGAAPAR
ncbi:MAG: hypothetical protein AVDCRST_MAG40-2615 [uncultured Gemmatimonadaceae bacterium]|uniref:Nuclease n=1 Tax=uncultured Gemmatimonadaceae bacterium TaxID=246130 RepID=A0A6J4M0D4_9BACT|nr:MAG: hypothetical protein AVDCRST_MAG40-2615 [uncultured Gemmatimonadaceae bacterium]